VGLAIAIEREWKAAMIEKGVGTGVGLDSHSDGAVYGRHI
jgi:hypothetical protein